MRAAGRQSERIRDRATPELARRLLEQLAAGSPDLRDAALVDAAGDQLAATDDADWTAGIATLWRAADRDGGRDAREIHVATGDGEVFSVRAPDATIVATSERFALASLMLCDLRAVLRELGERG